jgi:hypothetical protein
VHSILTGTLCSQTTPKARQENYVAICWNDENRFDMKLIRNVSRQP